MISDLTGHQGHTRPGTSRTTLDKGNSQGGDVFEATRQIASMLALAYQRSAKVRRVKPNIPGTSVNKELANSEGPSVHGHEHP